MKIALLQYNIAWENPALNKNKVEQFIAQSTSDFELLILPEMFTTGFSMSAVAMAESMDGETVNWLKFLAKKYSTAITGSLIIKENNLFYNRMLFVQPSGVLDYYDKRHLFTLAAEDKIFVKGKDKKVVLYKGIRFCLQVCYDLRFPVFARYNNDYDVLLYVANWPVQRINAWDALLKARAIENMCYTVGVNRVGEDANQFLYPGHSQVNDFIGRAIIEPYKNEGITTFRVDLDALNETRKRLNFLNDRDAFAIL